MAHACADRGLGARPPFPPPLLTRHDGRAHLFSPFLGRCRSSAAPLVTVPAPPAPPPSTRPCPIPDPPFSSLSTSVQAIRALFYHYRRVELLMAAHLTTSPPAPSDQTGAHQLPLASSEHLPRPDVVSHVESNLSPS
jgi:hypothetical protein